MLSRSKKKRAIYYLIDQELVHIMIRRHRQRLCWKQFHSHRSLSLTLFKM